jgi:hypothetical protein
MVRNKIRVARRRCRTARRLAPIILGKQLTKEVLQRKILFVKITSIREKGRSITHKQLKKMHCMKSKYFSPKII